MGHGCDTSGKDGDGVVSAGSVKLDFAENFNINGSCSSTGEMHTALIDPEAYPEVTEHVRAILS
jgi:proteasome assembly chaperone (PAC2) family protein